MVMRYIYTVQNLQIHFPKGLIVGEKFDSLSNRLSTYLSNMKQILSDYELTFSVYIPFFDKECNLIIYTVLHIEYSACNRGVGILQ